MPATLTYTGNGRYEGSYTALSAAAHALHLSLPSVGGLAATYYDAGCCFSMEFVRGHRIPDDLSEHVLNTSDLSVFPLSSPNVTFGVRWDGLVQSDTAGEYTFSAGVQGADERIKLWVDNLLLIDAW